MTERCCAEVRIEIACRQHNPIVIGLLIQNVIADKRGDPFGFYLGCFGRNFIQNALRKGDLGVAYGSARTDVGRDELLSATMKKAYPRPKASLRIPRLSVLRNWQN